MKRQISGENEVSSNWKTTYRKSRFSSPRVFFVQLYFVLRSINVEKKKKEKKKILSIPINHWNRD